MTCISVTADDVERLFACYWLVLYRLWRSVSWDPSPVVTWAICLFYSCVVENAILFYEGQGQVGRQARWSEPCWPRARDVHRCTRSLTPTGTAFTCKPGCRPTATRVRAHAHGDSTWGTPLAQPLGRFGAIIFILQARKWRQGLVSLTGPRPPNWPILGSRLGLQVPDSEPPLWGCVWPQTFGLTSVTSEPPVRAPLPELLGDTGQHPVWASGSLLGTEG